MRKYENMLGYVGSIRVFTCVCVNVHTCLLFGFGRMLCVAFSYGAVLLDISTGNCSQHF